jgi:hypothetical protein
MFADIISKSILLTAVVILAIVLIFVTTHDLKPAIGVQVQNHRVFVVRIDSAATDSLFGKTWRDK